MTLYDELKNAGLPISSASETGEVSGLPGVTITEEQHKLIYEITLRYLSPQAYERYLRVKQRKDMAMSEAARAQELRSITPDEAVNWIEGNVTSLATAKTALKIMVRLLIAMRNQIWPDLPE